MDFLNDVKLSKHETRLFPSDFIRSESEAEMRATASLLAMVRAVSEFGREAIHRAGARHLMRGELRCYTEYTLDDGTPDKSKWPRPDGIIYFKSGKYEWKALVEVKVGNNSLDVEQINRYIYVARTHGIDAVITISNHAAQQNGSPPIDYNRRIRSVKVCHFSWEHLLSVAQMLASTKAVKDKDQQWMLDEWIRYVTDPDSKIINPPDLGINWNDILKAASAGNLKTCAAKLDDIISHWFGFLRIVALRFSAELALDVKPRITPKEKKDPCIRIDRIKNILLDQGTLLGEVRIPRTVNDIQLILDISKKEISYQLEVYPPGEGRQSTRVNWLLRQLKASDNTPNDLLVQVKWNRRRLITWDYLEKVKKNVKPLYFTKEGVAVPKEAMPSLFILNLKRSFRPGRGRSGANDLQNVFKYLESFYQNVVVLLKPYEASPKKLPQIKTEEDKTDSINEGLKS